MAGQIVRPDYQEQILIRAYGRVLNDVQKNDDQLACYTFKQRNNKIVNNCQGQKNKYLMLIRKESKEGLGLGSKLEKKQQIVLYRLFGSGSLSSG